MHHRPQPLVMGGRDEGADGVALERSEAQAVGAAVLVDNLDPVRTLRLAGSHPGRRLVRAVQGLYGHELRVLGAVSAGRGREHAGGVQIRLVGAGQIFTGGALRRRKLRIHELVEHGGHPEAHRVVQRAAPRVHVAVDQSGRQRAAAAVDARKILRQVERLPDAPDATILDPHVLFRTERLSVEDLHADDRKADLRKRSVRSPLGRHGLGQGHEHAHEHGENRGQIRHAAGHGSF